MKMIILQGPPASGKTTWTKNYIENLSEKERKNTVIVSRDAIREITGTYWVPEREDYISNIEETMIKGALGKEMDVIIDATNLNPKTLEKLNKLALAYKAEVVIQEFYVPFEEALKRDTNRERPVGKKVLEQFYMKYYSEQYREELFSDKRYMKEPDESLPKCVLCDLDGTLAIHTSGRTAFEYHRIKEDTPDKRLVRLLNRITQDKEDRVELIFLSGRENIKNCREHTIEWLEYVLGHKDFTLIMREKGDHRPDQITKKELYEKYIKDKFDVMCVFDDRDKVVKMWRELGLLCNQVYYGDF